MVALLSSLLHLLLSRGNVREIALVRPETVLSWHRQGFRLFWTWISRRKRAGRPGVSPEVSHLMRKVAEANPLWGAPRIHGELLKLGINLSERTIQAPQTPVAAQATVRAEFLRSTILSQFHAKADLMVFA